MTKRKNQNGGQKKNGKQQKNGGQKKSGGQKEKHPERDPPPPPYDDRLRARSPLHNSNRAVEDPEDVGDPPTATLSQLDGDRDELDQAERGQMNGEGDDRTVKKKSDRFRYLEMFGILVSFGCLMIPFLHMMDDPGEYQFWSWINSMETLEVNNGNYTWIYDADVRIYGKDTGATPAFLAFLLTVVGVSIPAYFALFNFLVLPKDIDKKSLKSLDCSHSMKSKTMWGVGACYVWASTYVEFWIGILLRDYIFEQEDRGLRVFAEVPPNNDLVRVPVEVKLGFWLINISFWIFMFIYGYELVRIFITNVR